MVIDNDKKQDNVVNITLRIEDLTENDQVLDLTKYPEHTNNHKPKFLHGRIGQRRGWFPRDCVEI